MGVYFDEPKYPVIDKAPNIRKTVGNFNWKDYAAIGLFTAGSYPIGYLSGSRSKLARQSGFTATLLGLTAGYFYAYQSSSGRLMGMFPNDKEVEATLGKK